MTRHRGSRSRGSGTKSGCRDHRTNRLGTCKHIEGVLHRLRGNRAAPPRRRKPKGQKSDGRIEIFVDERDDRAVRMTVPEAIERADPAFVQEAGRHYRGLRRVSRKAFDALRDMARAHPDRLRFSRSLKTWIDARKAPARRRRERDCFVADLAAGRRSFEYLKHPLLPYQVEGALHLAFGERVLLADDMGLGKTVQAIAACTLLRELRGVERVLVVSPASLKAEWEEQIVKFSDLPSTIVFGAYPARLAAYRRHTFFTLCNYEQVVADGKVHLDELRPDVVILDEAQRIKNWQTKTANAVKELQSRYAFVLTGTPLENRIDEIYSIVQFLDPDQTRPVTVINLVSEDTIEHRMLGLLDAKRTLAEGVLDQRGDLSAIPLPTGRAAFMERLNAVLGAQAEAAAAAAVEGAAEGAARALTAVEQLRDDLVTAHGATLRRVFVRDGDEAVLVVLALAPERIAEEERRFAESSGLNVEVIDPTTHESMLRLAEAGLIALSGGELKELYPASGPERSESDGRILRAKALTGRAEHKLKAAVLLVGGGFAEEARAPAVEAARLAVAALAAMRGKPEPDDAESAAELLLGEEPDGVPGGPPHDAIRALSGDEPQDGEVARIEEFVSRITWMVADMSAPSRGAAG